MQVPHCKECPEGRDLPRSQAQQRRIQVSTKPGQSRFHKYATSLCWVSSPEASVLTESKQSSAALSLALSRQQQPPLTSPAGEIQNPVISPAYFSSFCPLPSRTVCTIPIQRSTPTIKYYVLGSVLSPLRGIQNYIRG